MRYVFAAIEAKQFTINVMRANPLDFGGPVEVERKVSKLQFEIIQLNREASAWH